MYLKDEYKHKGLRRGLVKILEAKGIKDPLVLKAIGKVPRHFYFDDALLAHAYKDKAFPIGNGQTISQPYTVARQSELLQIKKGDNVLEIGTGSGYQACILAEIGVKLYSIECIPELYQRARYIIDKMGYSVKGFMQDGTLGLPQFAPYDGIIVTAGAPKIPQTLLDQLKIGGRLVIPVGESSTQDMIRVIKKSENDYEQENHGQFSFVPLVGKEGW